MWVEQGKAIYLDNFVKRAKLKKILLVVDDVCGYRPLLYKRLKWRSKQN